ncbi:uncharacterized protein LOC143225188 isoform X2 [Tachypleus tridentatus]|uniref:uncharacterized protein LOC143225188 isoform X2 n=1 Tax=Tachypleus tridentatus TaxID=6853 RepID=UPI003FD3E7E7
MIVLGAEEGFFELHHGTSTAALTKFFTSFLQCKNCGFHHQDTVLFNWDTPAPNRVYRYWSNRRLLEKRLMRKSWVDGYQRVTTEILCNHQILMLASSCCSERFQRWILSST